MCDEVRTLGADRQVQMTQRSFFVVDRRVYERSLASGDYNSSTFSEGSDRKFLDEGVFVRLYGRTAEAQSVVCEMQLFNGLEIAFVLPEDVGADEVFPFVASQVGGLDWRGVIQFR